MNYNLMPVKYFIDVVQTNGFISAAKRNYVSETAVSSAIKKLENELGQKLLNRSAGELSLTPVGKEFYQRAVEIVDLYAEIWRHPDPHPERLLRIHFFQGLESETAKFAAKLPSSYEISFDEESLSSGIKRLINGNFDLLVGFQLAFVGNTKILSWPFEKVSFDLLFNKQECEQFHGEIKDLAQKSTLYMQNWKTTGIMNIQTAMLDAYSRDGWEHGTVAEVNSFAAACLKVNFGGGMTMVPHSFTLPKYCQNIDRVAPLHLKQAFNVVIALSPAISDDVKKMVKKVTTLSY